MILTSLFAALTAVSAFIKIPVGPVPITLQMFFIMLAGMLIGPYYGALSQIVYVLLGLIGVPIFASGGGISYIFTPSFGYLLGFILAPLVIGIIINHLKKKTFVFYLLACVIGLLAVYIVGVPYMYMILRCVTHTNISFIGAISAGFVVFIPGDIIKCIAAAFLGLKIAPRIKRV